MNFGGLSVGNYRSDPVAEGFEASHLRPDATSEMVARPKISERLALMARGAQGIVPDAGRRAVVLPRFAVLADHNDRSGIAFEDGGVTAAGIVGNVGRHRADRFPLWHLGAVRAREGCPRPDVT